MADYTIIDGKRVAPAVARAYWLMEAAFRARFGLDLIVSDGVRTYAEQKRLWDDYRSGRSKIRAANPDSAQAYHVETNSNGQKALDIRDSGGSPGVTSYGNARSDWIRDNARSFGFNPRGYHEFKEPWHIEYLGDAWAGAPASVGVPGQLMVDGNFGPSTIAKLQSVLGVAVDSDFGPQTKKALQQRLGVAQDGDIGPASIRALQERVGAAVDGDWGSGTTSKLQEHLNAGGTLVAPTAPAPVVEDAKLTVDGGFGPSTVKALQKSVGAEQDGQFGPGTIKLLQGKLGQTVDGNFGPQTVKALQTNVGATVDGQFGPGTVSKLQEFLNAGTQWSAVSVAPEAPVTDFVVTVRTPVYPKAAAGWNVPYGQNKRVNGKVTTLIVHHETAFTTQVPYFKTRNDRGNSPTLEVNGKIVTELIHPAKKSSSTGSANEYSIAIETTNTKGAPNWEVSEDSVESIAQYAAWLSQQKQFVDPDDGSVVKNEFVLDRLHLIGHSEAGVNATACPGPYLYGRLDYIVSRAKELAAIGPVVDPTPTPEPEEMVSVERSKLQEWFDWLKTKLGK